MIRWRRRGRRSLLSKNASRADTFEGDGEQGKDGCAHSDHYGANALNPGIRESVLQRLSVRVHLFDEVEEHDHMANDGADQAGDSEEGHKAEGRVHDGQRNQRPDGTVRGGSGDED
jgi:hypothetical protein